MTSAKPVARTLLGCLLVILGVVYLKAASRVDVGYFNDDARYVNAARSLIQGQYNDLELPGHPPNIDRLPGYPLFLAPLVSVFQPRWSCLQASSVVLTLLTGLFLFVLFADDLRSERLLLLVAFFGLNATVMKYSLSTMSEPLFLFVSVLTFVFLKQWLERRKAWLFCLVILGLSWAVLIRPEGIALLIAFPAGMATYNRRREALLAAFVPLLVLGAFFLRNYQAAESASGYWFQWAQTLLYTSGHLGPFLNNAVHCLEVLFVEAVLQAWLPFTNAAGVFLVSCFLTLAAILLTLVGFSHMCKEAKHKPLVVSIGVYVLLYVAMHGAFLSVNSRYFFGVIPFILVWLMDGAEVLLRRFRLSPSAGWLAAVLLVLYVNPWSSAADKVFTSPSSYHVPRQTYTWIEANTEPSAFVLAIKASTLHLYTNRYSVSELPAGSWKEFCTSMLRWKVAYILVAPKRLMILSGQNFQSMLMLWNTTDQWIPQRPQVFLNVYENSEEGTTLYRVVPAELEKLVRQADASDPKRSGYPSSGAGLH